MKIAVFPGSFDPITKGHESIIRRSLPLFDEIYIAIGVNSKKDYLFSLDQRIDWIKKTFENESKIKVKSYEGLTIEFCKNINARFIIRGLRNSADFEYEKGIGQINKAVFPELETIFLLSLPEYNIINSTIVRELIRYGGDVTQFLPEKVIIKKA